MQTIDIHAHIDVPQVEAHVGKRPEWPFIQEFIRKSLGEQSYRYNSEQEALNLPKSTDLSLRLKDMDRMGVDMQVISPAPMHYHSWADQELASELATIQNDHIAGVCASHPERFVGLGAVALQHPELALTQLIECLRTYGFMGVEISTAYPGLELSDMRLEPFWRLAEELEAMVLIHPLGSSLGERTSAYYLSNIIGQPLDTTLALAHLIYSGVFDRYPRLKVCAVHGGGFLPYYIGRFDHAFSVRPESQSMPYPPSRYLKRIFFDTVVFRPDMLANLIATAGIEQVVLGSDYPYDMGEYDIENLLESIPGLDRNGRDAILGGNAERMLGLTNPI
ncbi:MAG: amidohydrolase family protein [Syntrophaceae bacterium]